MKRGGPRGEDYQLIDLSVFVPFVGRGGFRGRGGGFRGRGGGGFRGRGGGGFRGRGRG